jgi:hypothetical protein
MTSTASIPENTPEDTSQENKLFQDIEKDLESIHMHVQKIGKKDIKSIQKILATLRKIVIPWEEKQNGFFTTTINDKKITIKKHELGKYKFLNRKNINELSSRKKSS